MSATSLRSRYFGDRAFYRMALAVAIPIMIQNGITNFVSLLDNIMVGQIGTEQMSGVAIVNQLLFVFNLCIFGGMSGAGIFSAQFYGCGDTEGIRHTFRFKVWVGLIVTAAGILLFSRCAQPLVRLFLTEDGVSDPAATLDWALRYLRVMLWGLPPFMILQLYASTLRECGETVVPMWAGIAAVLINLILNYILIYGKLGCPALGVTGAALATVVARYAEMLMVVLYAHTHAGKQPWVRGILRTLRVPAALSRSILVKGMPLLINELIWSVGQTVLMQCYSTRGLTVVAAMNISNTINNMFNIAFLAMGSAVAIILGQLLGAGRTEEAKDHCRKLIVFCVLICIGVAALQILCAPYFPRLYNTTEQVRAMATRFMIICSVFMPFHGFMNCTYFALRSGGRTGITFLFDSGFSVAVSMPVAFVLSRFTTLPAEAILAIVSACDWIKCALGFCLLRKGVWVRRIVS